MGYKNLPFFPFTPRLFYFLFFIIFLLAFGTKPHSTDTKHQTQLPPEPFCTVLLHKTAFWYEVDSLLCNINLNHIVYCGVQDIDLSPKSCCFWLLAGAHLRSSVTLPCKDSVSFLKTPQEGKFLLLSGALTLVLCFRDDLSNHSGSLHIPSCLNNPIAKTLSCTVARQHGHLTGIYISLISHLRSPALG